MRKVNKIALRDMILEGEDISQLDYSHITSMAYMFSNSELKTMPWIDTSNVTDMYGMFYNCHALKTVPNLDTSIIINKINTLNMFSYCYALESINPNNFPDYDWENTNSKKLREKYPELFI
jgi:hypothetical protein